MKPAKKHATKESLPDAEIVELYWQRQEKAIEATGDKYGAYLYTIAYNILADRLDSEECLNDTYMGAWNSIPPKRPNALQIFLSRIMRNIALGRFRRSTASRRIPSEMIVSLDEISDSLPSTQNVEEQLDTAFVSRIISDYLRSLTDRQAFVFICRYYYFDKVEKIAKLLDLSRNTVTRDLTAIREGLKKKLEQEGISL